MMSAAENPWLAPRWKLLHARPSNTGKGAVFWAICVCTMYIFPHFKHNYDNFYLTYIDKPLTSFHPLFTQQTLDKILRNPDWMSELRYAAIFVLTFCVTWSRHYHPHGVHSDQWRQPVLCPQIITASPAISNPSLTVHNKKIATTHLQQGGTNKLHLKVFMNIRIHKKNPITLTLPT